MAGPVRRQNVSHGYQNTFCISSPALFATIAISANIAGKLSLLEVIYMSALRVIIF